MASWFHKFFNPHCPDCIHERQENKICISCDTLHQLLSEANRREAHLLEELLEISRPKSETSAPIREEENQIIRTGHVPWRIKQQQLEQDDRKLALSILEKKRQEMVIKSEVKVDASDLEKEMGIVEQERVNAK